MGQKHEKISDYLNGGAGGGRETGIKHSPALLRQISE
jgi:hypothetical protein